MVLKLPSSYRSFDEALNARIKRRIEGCPSVRCVAAFERWPEGLDGFKEPEEVICETSWSKLAPTRVWDDFARDWKAEGGSAVYVYERDDSFLRRATSNEAILLVAVVGVLNFVRELGQLGAEPDTSWMADLCVQGIQGLQC